MKINDSGNFNLNDFLAKEELLKKKDPKKSLDTPPEDLYDLDLSIKEEPTTDPVDCSSETCNCKTKACHTISVGSCHSCGCTNSWGCNGCNR